MNIRSMFKFIRSPDSAFPPHLSPRPSSASFSESSSPPCPFPPWISDSESSESFIDSCNLLPIERIFPADTSSVSNCSSSSSESDSLSFTNRGKEASSVIHREYVVVRDKYKSIGSLQKIGEGEYKGVLDDGQVVAVKRAKKKISENLRANIKNEVDRLSKIDHRNLVKLLGFVDKGDERLIITEYVGNGTLRDHLDGARGKILDFNQRLEILIDVCNGLTYLHNYADRPIIHRDVNSSNILLTKSKKAKVADFWFAKGSLADLTQELTQVKETVSNFDPDGMGAALLTEGDDVLSFGMLLVEVLTGQRPVEARSPSVERITIRWAFKKFIGGKVAELADPKMVGVGGRILMEMFILAFQCADPIESERPDMRAVGEQLMAIKRQPSQKPKFTIPCFPTF